MTRAMYRTAVEGVTAAMRVLDGIAGPLLDDGITIEPIDLRETGHNEPIGTIFFDLDGHPYFKPTEFEAQPTQNTALFEELGENVTDWDAVFAKDCF